MICLSLHIVCFLGLGTNVTLVCLQALGPHPYARQALNIQHRCTANCSTPCYNNAGAIPSVAADLNDLNLLIAHFILDWLIIPLTKFQSKLVDTEINLCQMSYIYYEGLKVNLSIIVSWLT
jgi:hypothetical protein